jgi:hypothetical protein
MELMARTWGKKGLFTIYAGYANVLLFRHDQAVLTSMRARQIVPDLNADIVGGKHDSDHRTLLSQLVG